jgi:hypothetical protein
MRRIVCVLVVCALSVWVAGTAAAAGGSGPVRRATAASRMSDPAIPSLTCSTPLKLHNGPNQTGTLATVSARGIWINLSSISFDNMTSSFTVGACSVSLASATNGGGALYTRCLSAGCVENTMDLGWDNVISSVYLH